MKYILMCEGANELEIINILLENNRLKLSREYYRLHKSHKKDEGYLAALLQ